MKDTFSTLVQVKKRACDWKTTLSWLYLLTMEKEFVGLWKLAFLTNVISSEDREMKDTFSTLEQGKKGDCDWKTTLSWLYLLTMEKECAKLCTLAVLTQVISSEDREMKDTFPTLVQVKKRDCDWKTPLFSLYLLTMEKEFVGLWKFDV